MSDIKKIKNALISVFHKEGLKPLVAKLNELNINIYSTGGTQSFIEEQGINVNRVEDLTTYPSILGGRVKTLHPNVFGGILSRRELASDQEQLKKYNIPEIDLVIVDLYPFEKTVASGDNEENIRNEGLLAMLGLEENIDWYVNILLLCVLAAIGEELFFRGVCQDIISYWTNKPYFSIVITAVLFSIMHFQFYGFIPRFVMGLFLGLIMYWSRSIWLVALIHFLFASSIE